jgi:hypothetical protein
LKKNFLNNFFPIPPKKKMGQFQKNNLRVLGKKGFVKVFWV